MFRVRVQKVAYQRQRAPRIALSKLALRIAQRAFLPMDRQGNDPTGNYQHDEAPNHPPPSRPGPPAAVCRRLLDPFRPLNTLVCHGPPNLSRTVQ